MTENHIAVIGGGASAALLLVHLVQIPGAAGWSVDVYDRDDRFGRGIAYSTVEPCHMLNVRAANMSAYQDKKDDFELWATLRGYGPLDFAPRPVYGQYLIERMDEALHKFSSVQFISADVLQSRKVAPGRYDVSTAGGHKSYTHVVVATGNVKALGPVVEGDVESYHNNPWAVDYAALVAKSEVVLIGTGLSAVDAIQSLNRAGHKGNITTVSRHGLFPAVHEMPALYPPFDTGGLSPSGLMKLIRAHIKNSPGPWQAVIDSLRPVTNDIWQGWSPARQSIFLRRALTHWNIHRHRMAPDNAAVIQSLRDQGRLRMLKDRVLKISAPQNVVCTHQILPADAVINCMGYRYDTELGRVLEGDYRIGPARFGDLFETTAIPEIRAQAQEIAQSLNE